MATSTTATRKVVLPGAVIKSDNDKGLIEAVVNTGYRDRQNDVMVAGCWQKVVKEKQRPIIFWHHDLKELPLGSATYLEELAPGDPRIPVPPGAALSRESYEAGALLARMQFALETQRGHDAYVLARDGHVREWSVQFSNAPENEEIDRRKGVRIVKLVDWLVEISLVPAGASLGTYTIEAKAAKGRLESWLGPITEVVKEAAEDRAWERLTAAEEAAWETQYAVQQSIAKAAEEMAYRQLQNGQGGFELGDGSTDWAKWRRLRGL